MIPKITNPGFFFGCILFHTMNLDSPVTSIPNIGPYYTFKLKKLGIETIKDLLYHIPHRYQDFSQTSEIESLQAGEKTTIQGQIITIENIYTHSGKKLQRAIVSNGKDTIEVMWFNQTYLPKTLPPGTFVSLSGKVDIKGKKKLLISPQYEKVTSTSVTLPPTIHTGRLVPIYPETNGLSSKWLRSKVNLILPQLKLLQDYLPYKILKKYDLKPLSDSLNEIHFPENYKEAEMAKRRLAFDELLSIQLKNYFHKKEWEEKKVAHQLKIDNLLIQKFLKSLPFELTESQKKASKEILADLEKNIPMNRLLEGDVGSGKTVVASLACLVTWNNGHQSAIMAPTQILATQHYKTLTTLLSPLGVKIKLMVGGNKKETPVQGDPLYSTSSPDIFIGTTALVQKDVPLEKLGLVIIDEQHRFGVKQRAILGTKVSGNNYPHVLSMTATPIPRTVALTIYGDLALSTLDELPRDRVKIKTWVVPPTKRNAAYDWIKKRVKNTTEQAFIVCPLIDESDKTGMKEVKAAKAEFEKLVKKVFPDLRLALLHGKIKADEKNKIMDKMKKGEIDILVATPVVEVGIDIPQATIMMIEASDRFGLAQLHQLRGRVGRSNKQSYCLLFTESNAYPTLKRLKHLEKTHLGRELAEIDLKLRGPGEVYGTSQHGYTELKVASFNDTNLIKAAKEAAENLAKNINHYPQLLKIIGNTNSIAPN